MKVEDSKNPPADNIIIIISSFSLYFNRKLITIVSMHKCELKTCEILKKLRHVK